MPSDVALTREGLDKFLSKEFQTCASAPKPPPLLFMSRVLAETLGIQEGDEVWVTWGGRGVVTFYRTPGQPAPPPAEPTGRVVLVSEYGVTEMRHADTD